LIFPKSNVQDIAIGLGKQEITLKNADRKKTGRIVIFRRRFHSPMRMPVVSDVDNGNGAEAKSIVAGSRLRAQGVPNFRESASVGRPEIGFSQSLRMQAQTQALNGGERSDREEYRASNTKQYQPDGANRVW
jgi:hypothetical protein